MMNMLTIHRVCNPGHSATVIAEEIDECLILRRYTVSQESMFVLTFHRVSLSANILYEFVGCRSPRQTF